MLDRRKFLRNTGLASIAFMAGAKSLLANPGLLNKIGIQLFSVPKMLDTDFNGALEMLAQVGFKEIEMYGPYPFSTESAKSRWDSITPQLGFKGSGYFGKSQEEIIRLMKSHGFTVPSLHSDLDTLTYKMGELANAANQLGAKYVVLPSIPDDKRKTLDDYKSLADRFNEIGAEAKKYGVSFAYHNHGYGLKAVDGKIPVEIIFDGTDPGLVYLEMDLFWTTAGGADPIKLLSKYSGRYKMMHIKDMKTQARFSGDGNDASQWIALFPEMCSAGDGVLNLPEIIKTAKENGMKHFFVEQDMVADPQITLKRSFDYLNKI